MSTNSNTRNSLGEHKELIERYLPLSETDEKAQQLKDLMHTATRAGAGGTKAGTVGLRPQGLKKANDIIDFLTPGKFKKRQGIGTQEVTFDGPKQQAIPHQIIMRLPRDFCPDCNKRGRVPHGGCLNTGVYTEDRPDLGLKAGELYQVSFCQECYVKHCAMRKDPAGRLLMPGMGGMMPQNKRNDADRLVRVKKNTENFIKVMRLTSHWEIYTDGRQS